MSAKVSRRVVARIIAAKLLAEPARQEHWTSVLAAFLVEQNRTGEVDLIVNDIAHELHTQGGLLTVHVTSARSLDDAIRTELKHLLTKATKATSVALTEEVDPSLLGGLIARTPDATMDVSIRNRLQQLATIK